MIFLVNLAITFDFFTNSLPNLSKPSSRLKSKTFKREKDERGSDAYISKEKWIYPKKIY